MFSLYSCGFVCAGLSIWGCVQLLWLALLFYIESLELIHEASSGIETITDFDAFIAATKDGYNKVARNCFIAALIYILTFFLSLQCIRKAKARKAKKAIALENDDVFCTPKEFVPKIPKKERIPKKEKRKPKKKPTETTEQEMETNIPPEITY